MYYGVKVIFTSSHLLDNIIGESLDKYNSSMQILHVIQFFRKFKKVTHL